MYTNLFYILLIFTTITNTINATLTPNSPKATKKSKNKADKSKKIGQQEKSVFDRNLVSKRPTAKEILLNHEGYYRDTSLTHSSGMVLGYVTPWNGHGYEISKIFANKFSHISPVWLQVKRIGDSNYQIMGTHDVDANWMTDVRISGSKRGTKIVPRMLFDGWTGNEFVSLLTNDEEQEALAASFLEICIKYNFDGLVLEVWSQLAGRVQMDRLVRLVRSIGEAFNEEKFDLILVMPPLRGDQVLFNADHYNDLYDYVTGFSLMTYDFSNPQRPGPNAPLSWIEKCITTICPDRQYRDKILTGLNFYGYDYTPVGGGPIVGKTYLKKVEIFGGELEFDPHSEENYFEYSEDYEKHVVFYPTLYSINKRVTLANKLGTGLSIWEIGQGLDYFYDLL